jgi:hypothetical protein
MKRILTLVIALCIGIGAFAQFDAMMQKKANVVLTGQRELISDLPVIGVQQSNGYVPGSILTDPVTAVTMYDLQSNYSNQRRVYLYPDGTVGAVCIWSQQANTSWTDRGTGYNYFDGTSWGPKPTARVESIRVGWGEYLPFGATGEMIIAHEAVGPLVINTRATKGTGTWTQTLMPTLPSNITAMFWPRSVTNGSNHTNIHIIALTQPTGNGGQLYNGMNGALLYCQSLDGGTTWTSWTQLAGTSGTYYTNYTADTYSWAEPHGDTLAFTVGSSFMDQFLMKSTDNGTTWTKTIIYNSPYNLGGSSPNYFYCPDGTNAIALDNQGTAHVVFGLMQDSITNGASTYYYKPYTEGIAYWNENMPQLIQSLNPDSLFKHHQYVAWVKDTMVFYPPTGVTLTTWFTSLTSFPDLVIDNSNRLFLAWSGETTLVDPNNYTLRHVFGRDGVVVGDTVYWHNDTLVDITGDWLQYNFSECMFPSASPTSDDYVYILFQADDYGGSYVKSIGNSSYEGQNTPDSNYMTLIKWEKPWGDDGVNEKHEKPTFSVGQNFPNPVNGLTKVNVYIQNSGNLSLKVTDLTGQTLMNLEKSNVLPGVSQFVIDASQLSPGVYFYTVKQGDQSITKKMIIE